jgi:hypothetical protein
VALPHEAFQSPRILINRGRHHIEEANTRAAAFFKGRPYTKVIDFDPDTNKDLHKIRLTSQIPSEISAIVRDAADNLRSALDHAMYSAAVCLVGGAPKDTGFPISKDANGVRGELRSKRLSGNPPEIVPLLTGFEPHETGNPLLWGLNQIRNSNTHRIIVPVGAASLAGQIAINYFFGDAEFGHSRWDPAKNELEFMRTSHGSSYQYKVNVTFYAAFGNVEAVRGKDAMSLLRDIASEVERIISAVETETERLLRARGI